MATEEYTHTIVTQAYTPSLETHMRQEEEHATTPLSHTYLPLCTPLFPLLMFLLAGKKNNYHLIKKIAEDCCFEISQF